MKKLQTALFILFIVCSLQAQSQMKKMNDTAPLKALLAQNKTKIKSIESAFVQTKHLDVMSKDIVSQGNFYYLQPDKISLCYTKPFAYQMVINNGKISTLSSTGKKSVIDLKSNQQMKSMQSLLSGAMSGNIGDLKDFSCEYYEDATHYLLKMKPAQAEIQKYIKGFDIFIDKKDMSVSTLKIYESATDYTQYVFSQKKFNTLSDEKKFIIP